MALNRKQRGELKRLLNSIEADASDLLMCLSDDECDQFTLTAKAEIISTEARQVLDTLKG